MKVTVAILNWNGEALLRRFLPSVIENTPADMAEIVVADNGSTDGSVAMLEREFPSVKVLKFDRNYGYAGGYNRVVDMVTTPYVVLLNSDVAPQSRWLEPLVDELDGNDDVAACQPKIISVENPDKFEYAGACGGFLDKHGYPYCRGRLFDTVETDCGQYDTTVDVDWATGAALMIRTDDYRRAGGLPEEFFAHMEEIDLCWRLRNNGRRITVVPASVVRHLGGGSLPASSPRKTYLNFRNNLLLMWRNLPDSERSRALFVRRLLDTMAWGMYVMSGKWRHAGAIWRAHRHYAKMRRETNVPVAWNKIGLQSRPDLLIQYYIKRHRQYSKVK